MLSEIILFVVVVGVFATVGVFMFQTGPETIKIGGDSPKKSPSPQKQKKRRKNVHKPKQKKQFTFKKKPAKMKVKNHELLQQSLFGHGSEVTSCQWHPSGQFVLTASIDESMKFWKVGSNSLTNEVPEGYGLRSASCSDFEGKTRIVAANYGHLHFYSVKASGKKVTLQKKKECPLKLNAETLVSQMHPDGQWVVVVGKGNIDPTIRIVSTKGKEYFVESVNEMGLTQASVSACGRWIGVCGGMETVSLFNISITREGKFLACTRAIALRGHKGVVKSVTFSPCCTKAVTTCEDGVVRIFHIDVRWSENEDPRLDAEINIGPLVDYAVITHKHILACCRHEMIILNRATEETITVVENIQHIKGAKVLCMDISPNEKQVLICGEDKHAYIYNLPEV